VVVVEGGEEMEGGECKQSKVLSDTRLCDLSLDVIHD
jgi:hypothetical protein